MDTDQITGNTGSENSLDEATRFLRLSALERAVVIQSELSEGLTFDATPGQSVTVQTGTSQSPVVRITRPKFTDFQRDIPLVAAYSDLRSDRLEEIHVQIDDVLSFFGAATPLHPGTYNWTLEMLEGAVEFATMIAQRVKLSLGAPRPELFSPLLQPVIQTPSHGSFPSGHATQAFVIATLLDALRNGGTPAPDASSQLYRIASRIAANRTVAGVHYPSDSAAGAVLGISLGRYLLNRLKDQTGETYGYGFDGGNYCLVDGKTTLPRDCHVGELADLFGGGDSALADLDPFAAGKAPYFSMLWKKADKEWEGVWG